MPQTEPALGCVPAGAPSPHAQWVSLRTCSCWGTAAHTRCHETAAGRGWVLKCWQGWSLLLVLQQPLGPPLHMLLLGCTETDKNCAARDTRGSIPAEACSICSMCRRLRVCCHYVSITTILDAKQTNCMNMADDQCLPQLCDGVKDDCTPMVSHNQIC